MNEDLQARINELLNVELPGKKKTRGSVAKTGEKKWSLTFGGRLPGYGDCPGYYLGSQILDLKSVGITPVILHVYEPWLHDPVGPGITVILHSHKVTEYCPWKGKCHIRLARGPTDEFPDDFIAFWRGYYGQFTT